MTRARSEEGRRLGLTRAEEVEIMGAVRDRLIRRVGRANRETAFVVGLVTTAVAIGVLYEWVMGRLGWTPPGIVKWAALGGLLGGVFAWMVHSAMRAGFHAELARRGHGICPACGYLREGMDPRAVCPECGGGAFSPPSA